MCEIFSVCELCRIMLEKIEVSPDGGTSASKRKKRCNMKGKTFIVFYSEVPNRRADRNKRAGLEETATLLAYLLSKLINEQGGIFRLLHEKLRAGWKENLKTLSEHAFLLGTSE